MTNNSERFKNKYPRRKGAGRAVLCVDVVHAVGRLGVGATAADVAVLLAREGYEATPKIASARLHDAHGFGYLSRDPIRAGRGRPRWAYSLSAPGASYLNYKGRKGRHEVVRRRRAP